MCDAEIHAAWNDLLKAWTFPVIHELGLNEPSRFNGLKKQLLGISATSLSERLTELEQRKIIERKVYPETPPRVEYSLTQKGWELHALILQLAEWVDRWHRKQPIILETTKPQRTALAAQRS